MRIHLLDGNTTILIESNQKNILKKIANEILEKISFAYTIDDVSSIRFNLKGDPLNTNALLATVFLSIRESNDILSVMKTKLSLLNINKTPGIKNIQGLSFLYFHQSDPILDLLYAGLSDTKPSTHTSQISFWYELSEEESKKWNSTNSYGFVM